jgi:hypothetical protein
MLRLLKSINRLRGQRESLQLMKATARPREAQREFLLKLLQRNQTSAFGVEHDFKRIESEADYRRRVPVRDYEGFRAYVERIVAGESHVLTTADPLMLTMTSGTTAEPKYIPVTRESQSLNASLMRQWLYLAERDHRGLTAQSSVGLVSRAVEGRTPSGLAYGSASGLIYQNIPWLVRRAYAIPYLVSELQDYDERYFVAARLALSRRVSFIATPNASTLVRLAQVASENQERILRAIHDGTLGLQTPRLPSLCARLEKGLRPDPARAQSLERVIKTTGALRLSDCWPDLKLIGCWLGGSAGAQIPRLRASYGEVPLRDLGYMASEGHITVPSSDFTASGTPALRSSYYEFIPEDEAEEASPTVLSIDELEAGRRYSILLTTAAGLYRYKINDIVEVTGFEERAPLLAFVRKSGEMCSITGEKMHVNHFVQALEELRRRFNLPVEQYRATPDYQLSRYEIYIELNRDVPEDLLEHEVLPALDEILARFNLEYEQKRKSKRLDAPILHLMARGWGESSLRQYMLTGRRDTQFKWRVLCPERRADDTPFITKTFEPKAVRNTKAEFSTGALTKAV